MVWPLNKPNHDNRYILFERHQEFYHIAFDMYVKLDRKSTLVQYEFNIYQRDVIIHVYLTIIAQW